MKQHAGRIKVFILCIVVGLLSLLGCGGSGGGSGNFSLFATDDANTGYSGVWVKIYRASLKSTTGTSVDVLTSTDGISVNLRALNDGAAKFLLLAPGQVPNGTYNKVVFELDKSVTLVATPSGIASTAHFPDSLDATVAGHSNITLDLSPNITIPGSTKVIADFDLKNWTVVAGVITPVMKEHDGTGFGDPNRHEKFEFNGIVSGLSGTSPTQTFTLTLKSGGSVTVSTDDTTSIVADGTATALANSLKVEVYGALDPTTNNVAAKIIRVDSEFSDEQKAVGGASNGSVDFHTFTLTPKCVRGFVPQGESITVNTATATKFRGRHGVNMTEADFYLALTAAGSKAMVEAEGTYDAGTNTLTAKGLSFEDESEFGDAEAKGTTSNPDSVGLAFDFAVTESGGFNGPSTIHVVVAADAVIKNKHGVVMTVTDFFTALAGGSQTLEIKGAYASNVFTATRIKFDN